MTQGQFLEVSAASLQIPQWTPVPAGAESRLRILPLSDLHLPKSTSATILANRDYLDAMDYVVYLGDAVSCYGTEREYTAVANFVRQVARPYNAVCGNHEWFFQSFHEDSGLYGQVWSESGPEERREALARFQAFWQKPQLWHAEAHPLGHFVFLSLDNLEALKQESLSTPQLEFLAAQILRAGDAPLFVFCHAPLNLGRRLDLVYYDTSRTGCIDAEGEVLRLLNERKAPSFWMSGHVHLRPDHYLFPPYRCGGNVWQIHCPDSWGYGRWLREQNVPQRYDGVFSRHLEIDTEGVTFLSHSHSDGKELARYRVDYSTAKCEEDSQRRSGSDRNG